MFTFVSVKDKMFVKKNNFIYETNNLLKGLFLIFSYWATTIIGPNKFFFSKQGNKSWSLEAISVNVIV